MRKIFNLLFILLIFNIINNFAISKEITVEDRDNSIIGVVRGVYSDGRIGNKDNIFLLIGFNDAKKIYNDIKLSPNYKEIFLTEKDSEDFKITDKDIDAIKWKKDEFKHNAETWKLMKNVPPKKEDLKDIVPSKEEWKSALPSEKERRSMQDRITADFVLHPIDLTKKVAEWSNETSKNNFKFFINNSLDYSKNIFTDSKNMVIEPIKQ